MIFKINWGDMKPLVERIFKGQEESTPITYFESEEFIIIYVESDKGNIWCSPVPKAQLSDPVAFHQEFLKTAKELLEPLNDKVTLVIKQE